MNHPNNLFFVLPTTLLLACGGVDEASPEVGSPNRQPLIGEPSFDRLFATESVQPGQTRSGSLEWGARLSSSNTLRPRLTTTSGEVTQPQIGSGGELTQPATTSEPCTFGYLAPAGAVLSDQDPTKEGVQTTLSIAYSPSCEGQIAKTDCDLAGPVSLTVPSTLRTDTIVTACMDVDCEQPRLCKTQVGTTSPVEPTLMFSEIGASQLSVGWSHDEPSFNTNGLALGQLTVGGKSELLAILEDPSYDCGASPTSGGEAVRLSASNGEVVARFQSPDVGNLMGLPMILDVSGDPDTSEEAVMCELSSTGQCHALDGDTMAPVWSQGPFECAAYWNMGPSAGELRSSYAGDEVVVLGVGGQVQVLESGTGHVVNSTTLDCGGACEPTGEMLLGHAAIADVDPAAGNEIVVFGVMSGTISVLSVPSSDGGLTTVYTSTALPNGGFAQGSGAAIADIDHDGAQEIIVAGADGSTVYAFSTQHGVGCKYQWTTSGYGYYWTSPVVGDVDGDGDPEVVVFSNDAVLSVLEAGGATPSVCTVGTVSYEHTVSGPFAWFTPALAQLAGSSALDVVVASATRVEVVDVQSQTVAYDYDDASAEFYPSAVILPGTSEPTTPAAHIFVSGWSNGTVLRLDTANGTVLPAAWSTFMGSNQRRGL